MSREEKGFLIGWVIVVGMMAAIIFHYYQGQVFHKPWPMNNFLFGPTDAWKDFYNIFLPIRTPTGPFSSPLCVYFPFMYLVLYPLLPLGANLAFITSLLLFVGIVIFFINRHLLDWPVQSRRLLTAILVTMSYPILFCIDRGNLEMFVFIFLAAFLRFYRKNIYLAIVFLAAAGAAKGYPLVFLILFIIDHRYREAAFTLLTVLFMTLIAMMILPGGIHNSLAGLLRNLSLIDHRLATEGIGLAYSAGFYSVIMNLGCLLFKTNPSIVYSHIALLYPIVCVALFGGVVYYVLRFESIEWKKLSLLTCSMILFPQMSFDYKLIFLLIPLMSFISAAPALGDQWYAWIFGLLLIPKAYYFFAPKISISVFINPLLMTFLTIRIVWEGLTQRVKHLQTT